MRPLHDSPALWNRRGFDPDSDEVLAQVLDRGELADWRALYAAAAQDPELRRRITAIVLRVPVSLPRFWLAAMRSLGEDVALDAQVPRHDAFQV